jgi:hypothetical protein
MGYYSEKQIEMEELEEAQEEASLHFDERNYTDGAWWSNQDAEMREEEIAHVERQAEIQEYRTQGHM